MKVFTIRDKQGRTSCHLAVSAHAAMRAHCIHYNEKPRADAMEFNVVSVNELADAKRTSICWNLQCCLIAAISDT